MTLETYFQDLIKKVESTQAVQNDGKDKDGFYLPTRTILIRHLNMLKDLHGKPGAKAMVRDAWGFVTEHLPPEWLVLDDEQKTALKAILKD